MIDIEARGHPIPHLRRAGHDRARSNLVPVTGLATWGALNADIVNRRITTTSRHLPYRTGGSPSQLVAALPEGATM